MTQFLFFAFFALIALAVVGLLLLPFVYPLLTRGKGKVEIALPRTTYAGGEVLSGSVAVTSRREVVSNRLYVALVCRRDRERQDGAIATHEHVSDEVVRIEADLDGVRTYAAGEHHEYPFSLRVPQYVEQIAREGGPSQRVLEVGVKLLTGVRDRVEFKWYVEAYWDVAGLDIRAEQKLHVTFSA